MWEIRAQNVNGFGLKLRLGDDVKHGRPLCNIRHSVILLHDRIHPAADKGDIRKPLLQFPINIIDIAAEEVMHADRKNKDGRRMGGQLADDVADAFDCDLLQIGIEHILLLDDDAVEPVRLTHFRSGHRYAPHAVVCTDIDLVRLRKKHPDMNDVPALIDRRTVFQRPGLGLGKVRLCDPHSGVVDRVVSNSFKHDPIAPGP